MLGTGFYVVTVSEWSGRIVWQSGADDLTSVEWGRSLSEESKATVSASIPAGIVDLIEPWLHVVTVYRGGDLVWEGVAYIVTATASGVSIEAFDTSVLFQRRRIPISRRWDQHDATQVMRTMVGDALGFRDPTGLVDSIVAKSSRVWFTGAWEASSDMVGAAVGDLVDLGLTWTVAAGRLIIGPVVNGYSTAQLSDRDFSAEVAVVKDGSEVVTDALVNGDGVWGQYAVDSPLGLIQSIEDAEGAVRASEAEEQARRVVEESRLTPRRLDMGGGARLLPSAPVTLDELIPGVRVPVSSSQTGITVGSTFRLLSVEVSVDGSGESVSVTLGEPAATDDPAVLPGPAPLDLRSPFEKENAGRNTSGAGSGAASSEAEVGTPPV